MLLRLRLLAAALRAIVVVKRLRAHNGVVDVGGAVASAAAESALLASVVAVVAPSMDGAPYRLKNIMERKGAASAGDWWA